MPLLVIVILYLVGILLGQQLFQSGWLGCWVPSQLWLLPLALLPFTPLLNRRLHSTAARYPLRWPERAGFERPRHGPSSALILAAFLALFTGGLRYAAYPLTPCWTPADLAYYNIPAAQSYDRSAPEVTLLGYVSNYPLHKDTKQQFHVTVQELVSAESVGVATAKTVRGVLRVTTNQEYPLIYGQALRLQGRLVTPPDFTDFSYREYLARKGVHSLFYATDIEPLPVTNQGNWFYRQLYHLRAQGEVLLNRQLPEPYAALANGMLLGIETGIPDALYEQFNLTGSSHVIVISGSNVALIAGMLLAIGQRLVGRRRAIWPTLCGICAYAFLVGGDAAVLRAAWMGALYAIATTLERRNTAIVSLAFACGVMTIVNPLTFWDVGFQLSSAATAGLILFSAGVVTFFQRLMPRPLAGASQMGHFFVGGTDLLGKGRNFMQSILQDGFMVTIAANISTLPLVLYYFERISLISLVTNVLIAPVQPFIMVWGTIGLIVGVAGIPLVSQILLWIPWLSLVWTVAIVQWTAALPGASLALSGYTLPHLLGTYLLIAVIALRSHLGQIRHSIQRAFSLLGARFTTGLSLAQPLLLAVLAVAVTLLWSVLITQPDGRLHLYFLNIGQGDGIFIQTPSGRQILIDGGASPQQLTAELGAIMPFWDRTIDLVIATHPDSDHIRAQSAMAERMGLDVALESAASGGNPDAEPWRAAMTQNGTIVAQQAQGNWLDLGDGVALWILWPTTSPTIDENTDNENSLVAKLVYGELTVLLTGDAGLPSEAALLAANLPLQATVLKVGHHGSKSSSGQPFLDAVQPQLAIIQVGEDNQYGHPHQEVLSRLAGLPLLRNDHHGRIHLSSDGERMWIETETKLP